MITEEEFIREFDVPLPAKPGRIRLELSADTIHGARLINEHGDDMSLVRSVRIEAAVDEPTRAFLEVLMPRGTIEADVVRVTSICPWCGTERQEEPGGARDGLPGNVSQE